MYSEVDGDSATMAMAIVMLSAIRNIPIRQDLAITGSMSQLGEAQPIVGLSEKIEGFWGICKLRGLTGTQGVIFPKDNINSIFLSEEIARDVEEGRFHLYAVGDVYEAFELMTGIPLKYLTHRTLLNKLLWFLKKSN